MGVIKDSFHLDRSCPGDSEEIKEGCGNRAGELCCVAKHSVRRDRIGSYSVELGLREMGGRGANYYFGG